MRTSDKPSPLSLAILTASGLATPLCSALLCSSLATFFRLPLPPPPRTKEVITYVLLSREAKARQSEERRGEERRGRGGGQVRYRQQRKGRPGLPR